MDSSIVNLPGMHSVDKISKLLLTAAIILQVGSYVEPFIFIWDGSAAWYLWLALNVITLSFAVSGISIRCGCGANQTARAWTPGTVTVLFWTSIILCGFGLLQLVAFVLYYSIAHSFPRHNYPDFGDRFGDVIILCFQLAPPLVTYGLGSAFFYRRATELRDLRNAEIGYDDVEMQQTFE